MGKKEIAEAKAKGEEIIYEKPFNKLENNQPKKGKGIRKLIHLPMFVV
ncbi:hypothetical protein KZP23_15835 [Echinicola marina]|nr:hypothetical protein [Echinicola marina]UCS92170.1 hypothetical protein KZP23_15835 [Echinicola marina]